MDLEKFKKYVMSRKKLEKEFDDEAFLDSKYNQLQESKKKYNGYHREYYKERVNNDEQFKLQRKEYNKKSYDKKKNIVEKQDTQQNIMQVAEPVVETSVQLPQNDLSLGF